MGRNADRRAILGALDSLIGWGSEGSWIGNVVEVWHKVSDQGNSHISEYLIRKVLRERGRSMGQGQYRVLRKDVR